MGEFLGWVEVIDWATTLFSQRSRRDYPTVLILILFLAACAFIYLKYFR